MRNTDLDGVACSMVELGWLVQVSMLALDMALVRIPLGCLQVRRSVLRLLVVSTSGCQRGLNSLDYWLVDCYSVLRLLVVSTSGCQRVLDNLDYWLVDCCNDLRLLVVSTSGCQLVDCYNGLHLLVVSTLGCQRVLDNLDY